MEISPQEAPPGPSADGNAEEAPAEARPPSPASSPTDCRLKAAAKRVTFPSDEDIVSGAVEPKDPWRHAQNVTVDEVIGAYKQACQKLNCRQIPKLLRQLQVERSRVDRVRAGALRGPVEYSLENAFLSGDSSQALHKYLKPVAGASALFDMIECYDSATHLNISFNKHIGTRGWQAAAHMMRKVDTPPLDLYGAARA
ncbi:protein phosphatase 1 regulatory subunit 37 [Trichechus manatus latirostris]|uniref:Protein phosphatase 1 regulatory subunit 37 n=1 Tax=Trichechus manatus latirostris TaxID=127582 RepID=A0A2Y9S353_TRIMA|nr:protein phosphatase 1 regulatory subunit 37 [Trichechus manatus latirostris]